MNTIIIEDEKPAAEKLMKAIEKTNRSIEVLAVLDSVDASVNWLHQNAAPDLVFMDIELGDGLSFKIFDKVKFNSPVIFCTAYDEYWQEAFEHNSIDYLLKPVRQEKLEIALNKYDKLKQHFSSNFQQLQQWHRHPSEMVFKKRFLVKRGLDYISIKAEEIAYFFAAHKVVCIVDNRNQKYIIDQSLGEIEKQVDPANFYRVNRKYLVQQNAIKKIKSFPKSKLQLELEPAISEDVIISQENVMSFKEWMGQ
jgi:two-component system LytT family response regulator